MQDKFFMHWIRKKACKNLTYENILIIFALESNSDAVMPRRRKLRKVVAPPGFRGYRPYGVEDSSKDYIDLLYEEYEAIKLADYDLMNHLEASKLMEVSRPTFARIYESARRKIAQAMVESKEIKTSYGNAVIDDSWFVCIECEARFTIPVTMNKKACAICASENIRSIIKE